MSAEESTGGRAAGSTVSTERANPAILRRIQQVDALLHAERDAPPPRDEGARRDGFSSRRNWGKPPHLFAMVLPAALIAFLAIGSLTAYVLTRPAVTPVADYRLGPRYNASPISDGARVPGEARIILCTRGGGVHMLDARAHFWRTYTQAGTGGGLLRDDVVSVEQDTRANLYFLCTEGGINGLCRASRDLGRWDCLVDLDRFAALAGDHPAQPTAACFREGKLWLTTDKAGIGEYDRQTHRWVHVYTAEKGELPTNRIYDVAAAAGGTLFFGTGDGVSRLQGDQWKHFGAAEGLAGRDVRRVIPVQDQVWYRTQGMGVGLIDGAGAARTVVSEGSWAPVEDGQVVAAASSPTRASLWLVASGGAVGRYDVATRGWRQFPAIPATPRINELVVAPPVKDRPESLWAASPTGVWTVSRPRDGWRRAGLDNRNVLTVAPGDGYVAAGTRAADDRPLDVSVFAEGPMAAWRKVQGGGAADVSQAALVGAALDPLTGRVFAADADGIRVYDGAAHEWSAPWKPADAALAKGKINDLAWGAGKLWCLLDNRTLASFDGARTTGDPPLGGGEFGADATRIVALDADAAERLWMVADDRLGVYDPRMHRWTVLAAPKGVEQLVCTSSGTWLLAQQNLYHVASDPAPAAVPVKVPLPSAAVRWISGHRKAPPLVLCDDLSRLYSLGGPAAAPTLLVGRSATKVNIDKITLVGVTGSHLLAAEPGQALHSYDLQTHDWAEWPGVLCEQIVSTGAEAWIRAPDGRLCQFRDKPAPVEEPTGVRQLAAGAKEAIALAGDGSIWFGGGTRAWTRVVESAGAGPTAAEGAAACWLVWDDDLLVGTKEALWRFHWRGQQWKWQAVVDEGSKETPLGGVADLAQAGGEPWALTRGGELVRPRGAGNDLWQVTGRRVRKMHATGEYMAALYESGAATLYGAGKALPLLPDAGPKELGARPLDAAVLNGKLFVATEAGTAMAGADLVRWTALATDLAPKRFVWSEGAATPWLLADDDQKKGLALYRLDLGGTPAAWKRVATEPVARASAFARAGEAKVCLVTTGGQVLLAGDRQDKAETVLAPVGTGRPVTELADVKRFGELYYVAARKGPLCTYDAAKRQWRSAGLSDVDQLLATSSPRGDNLWARTSAGRVLRLVQDKWVDEGEPVRAALMACPAGDGILAVTSDRCLVRIGPDKKMSVLRGPWRPESPLGPILAAAPLKGPAGGSLLLLSDGKALLAYDRESSRWSTLKPGAVQMVALGDTVRLLTEDGHCGQVTLDRGEPKVAMLPEPSGIARLAAGPVSTDVQITLQKTGEVTAHSARGAKVLVGAPTGWKEADRVSAVCPIGDGLLVAAASAAMYAYDPAARAWAPAPKTAPLDVKRLVAAEGTIIALSGTGEVHGCKNGQWQKIEWQDPGTEFGPPQRVTAGGNAVYLADAKGRVRILPTGEKPQAAPDLPGPAAELAWVEGALVATDEKGSALRLSNGQWAKLDKPPAAPASVIQWQGRPWKTSLEEGGFSLASADGAPPDTWRFETARGRFDRDQVRDVALTGKAAWLITAAGLCRVDAETGKGAFAGDAAKVPPASLSKAFTVKGQALVADAEGKPVVSLTEGAATPLGDAEARTLAGMIFEDDSWRVRAGLKEETVESRSGDQWLNLGYGREGGMATDDVPALADDGKAGACAVTRAGFITYDAAAETLKRRGAEVLPEGVTFARADRLLRLSDGAVWVRFGDDKLWSPFDARTGKFAAAGPLGEKLLADSSLLCGEGPVRWSQVPGRAPAVARASADGKALGVHWNDQGMFDSDTIGDAVLVAEGLWLATDAGLELVDPATLKLVAFEQREGVGRGTRLALRNGRLQADLAGGTTLVCDGKTWTAGEPSRGETVLSLGALRVHVGGAEPSFALQSGDREEVPVKLTKDGRFDFQQALDVVVAGRDVAVLSPVGLWTRGLDADEVTGARPLTPAQAAASRLLNYGDRPTCLALVGEDAALELQADGQWKAVPRPKPADGVRTQSARWRVSGDAKPGAAGLEVSFDGKEYLPLPEFPGPAGFPWQRPTQVAADGLGGCWAAHPLGVTHYKAGGGIADLYSPTGFGKQVPDRVALIDSGIVARAAGKWFAFDGATWRESAQAAPAVAEKESVLASAGGWEWSRTAEGKVSIARTWGSARMPIEWAEGRFSCDTVSHAAVRPEGLVLATQAGLIRRGWDTPAPQGVLPKAASPCTALREDRATGKLAAQDARGWTYLALGAVAGLAEEKAPATETAATAERLACLYADATWRFGKNGIRWKNVPVRFEAGRFAHDIWRSVATDGNSLWVATAGGVAQFDLSTPVPTMAGLGLADEKDLADVAVDGEAVRVLGAAKDFVRKTGDPWVAAPEVSAGRTLVQTDRWTWRRRGGRISILAGREAVDVPPDPAARLRDGRFPEDAIQCLCADGADLWQGTADGVLRVNAATGQRRWYRTGTLGNEKVELGAIARLSMTRAADAPSDDAAKGRPVLWARDGGGRLWRFAGGDGPWRGVDSAPALIADEAVQAWAGMVEARRRPSGGVSLAYCNVVGTYAGKVLEKGRFVADNVRGLAVHDGRCYLATPAGVVGLDAADGAYQRLWAAPKDEQVAAMNPTDVLVHSADGRLYAVAGQDKAYVLEKEGGFAPVAIDEKWRTSAQVMVGDDFWHWYRWGGQVGVVLHKSSGDTAGWRLFVDGRFSFDVIRDLRIDGDRMWVTTAGGIVRYKLPELEWEWLETRAKRSDGKPGPLYDAGRFVPGDRLRAQAPGGFYTLAGNDWTWRPGTAVADAEMVCSDRLGKCQVRPMGPRQGVFIEEFDAYDRMCRPTVNVPDIEMKDIVEVLMEPDTFWICTKTGLYRMDR